MSRPREALVVALSALEGFYQKRALPNAARAHAAAAQCYFALESQKEAMHHVEQSQFLAERFASPAELLQIYTACANVAVDRRVLASVKELRRSIEATVATLPNAPITLSKQFD